MTGTLSPLSSSEKTQREQALKTVETLREALAGDDLQQAITQINILQTQLIDWKRREARAWLDESLRGDLLLFNLDAANKRLEQWAGAIGDIEDRDLELYRERVRERGIQKQRDLQARGVAAHCAELWQQAAKTEHSEAPSKPDFVLETYYLKARNVAQAAQAEAPENANLNALLQQAERLVRDKRIADTIYQLALEEDHFAEALDKLDALETITLIPRYRPADKTSNEITTFDRMIALAEARDEIARLGRVWAVDRAAEMQTTAEDHLKQFRPQAAYDLLLERKLVERFVTEAVNQTLRDLEARANNDLRLLEQAERRARQAQRLAAENPVGAWDVYVDAYQTYRGAPALRDAHTALMTAMSERIREAITRAEQAFDEKHMDRIQQIYRGARLDYGDKDDTLEELLAHLAEIDRQARAYGDYMQNARIIMDQLRDLVWENVSAAGELLSELEQYPGIVLDDLEDLGEVRALVRQRLNVEVVYNQLRQLLMSDNAGEVEAGIQAAQQYDNENRFVRLIDWLEIHRAYLQARKAYAIGDDHQALNLLDEIARQEGHPDRDSASALAAQIRTDATSTDHPPDNGVDI